MSITGIIACNLNPAFNSSYCAVLNSFLSTGRPEFARTPILIQRALRFNRLRDHQPGKDRLNLLIVSVMTVFHVGAVAALFFFTWNALFVAILLYWVVGSLGIGMGYHRLLTHRGYKTPKWIEYLLTVCAVVALEGGPLLWVATHRIHHQFPDQDGDPHSPRDGKWWAHVGWILVGNALRQDASTLDRYAPDLAEDKFHVWITEYHFVPIIVVGLALVAFGGLPFLLWGIFLRTVVGLHATWLVNSATHIWGSRRFETRDQSTNSWWVAVLTFGEGWHNNHHAHPVSARHGLKWYEIDFNWYGIWTLKQLGLASQIYRAKLPTRPDLGTPLAAPSNESGISTSPEIPGRCTPNPLLR